MRIDRLLLLDREVGTLADLLDRYLYLEVQRETSHALDDDDDLVQVDLISSQVTIARAIVLLLVRLRKELRDGDQ